MAREDALPTSQTRFQGRKFVGVTASDSVDLTIPGAAIYVGTGGNIVLVDMEDNAETFKNVPDGTFLPVRVKRVNATDTTALDIIAIY